MPLTITPTSRVVMVTHELFYGASQALRDYLNGRRANEVVFISHPIRPENPRSYVQYFKKGRQVSKRSLRRSSGDIFWYALDFFLTIVWAYSRRGVFDVYIGVDPLNCSAGLLLKALGFVRRVIFYSIDFVPRRFSNRFLDAIYHVIEALCVRFADERWDVSPRIAQGREKFLHLSSKKFPARVVPIGVWKKDIMAKSSPFDSHRFAFAGHLLLKQGVGKVLEAMPSVVKKVKDATFLIIGGGEKEKPLRQLAKALGVAKHVEFTGWVSNQNKVRKLLAGCSFAVATYDPSGADLGNFTYYADPTKIKTYVSCGLPVIMTDIAYNAQALADAGCAKVVPYEVKAIARALVAWFSDRKAVEKARGKAIAVAKTFTWERIFKKALQKHE